VVLENCILTNNNDLLEICSSLVYNITCHSSNFDMLLLSEYYLNTMISMMRSGKELVQSNVVEAMRNMCCHQQAAKWLMQKDILPDFVVVALLRTNSDSIKSICCDAFYNLLCHEDMRNVFVGGDLWWSMMKVARSEVERIRVVAAKALFNLSCRDEYIQLLRKQNVIGFCKDFSTFASGNEPFVKSILVSVHNIALKFDTPFDAQERGFALSLVMTALDICREVETVVLALKIMLKTAHDCLGDKIFIEMDIIGCLERNEAAWGSNVESLVLVSHILFVISQESVFTKSVSFYEFSKALVIVHKNLFNVAKDESDNVNLNVPIFVRENTSAILATYAVRREVSREDLLRCSLWDEIVSLPLSAQDRSSSSTVTSFPLRQLGLELTTFCNDALGVGGPILSRPPTVGAGGHRPKSAAGGSHMDSPGGRGSPINFKTFGETKTITPNEVSNMDGEFIHLLNPDIMQGLIGDDLLFKDSEATQPQYDPMTGSFKPVDVSAVEKAVVSTFNMMTLIDAFCQIPRTASLLVEANICDTLLSILQIDKSSMPSSVVDKLASGVGGVERFVTSILLTLTSEETLLNGLKDSPSLAQCFMVIIEQTIPSAGDLSGASVRYASEVFADLVTILYRFTKSELDEECAINSELVIHISDEMMTRSMNADDKELVRLCRHVIGYAMDKYRLDQVCSMANVQSMLVELHDESAATEVPAIILDRQAIVPKLIFQQSAGSILSRGSQFMHCTLIRTPEPDECWRLIQVSKLKKMTALLNHMDSAKPSAHWGVHEAELFSLTGYHKMMRQVNIFPASPNFKKGRGPGVGYGGLTLGDDGDIEGYEDDFEAEAEADDELRTPQTTSGI
jgi:hypothetical protein